MIIIISSLHHIPERRRVFELLSKLLNPKGTIVISEPSHYMKKIIWILKKRKMMFKKVFLENIENYSTHHSCSAGEYKKIIGSINDLSIKRIDFDDPSKKENMFFKKLFSSRIHMTIQKDNLY